MSRAAPDTEEYPEPTTFPGRPITSSGILPYSSPTSTVAPELFGSGGSTSGSSQDDSPSPTSPPTTAATVAPDPPTPRTTTVTPTTTCVSVPVTVNRPGFC
jgi:hypothetical protein